MMIKFLTGHKRVATSLDKLNAGKDYLLINREAEAIETNKVNNINIFSSTPLNIGSVSSLLSSIPSEKIIRYV